MSPKTWRGTAAAPSACMPNCGKARCCGPVAWGSTGCTSWSRRRRAGWPAGRRPSPGAPQVWQVEGRALTLTAPEPIGPAPRLDAEASAWVDRLRAAGAEPVVEAGVLTGEVLGLEVARVVSDADGSRLEVGVGKHDRDARRAMSGDVPTQARLSR